MAGAGYKLFTTGQVLTAAEVNTYLQEQTVMVFNDAASRTTALSGVLAEGMVSYLKSTKVVEIYNGTAWASLDDPNAIQNTIVDAKGDLIAATGNDVPARLAVGNNGETLVADSSTSTGLRWNPSASLANPLINSGFDIAQRGTSFTNPNLVYVLDRWQTGVTTNKTISRVATNDTTNLPFIQYACRIQRTNGTTTTGGMDIGQSIETTNSIPFAGRTITFSFYARCGANYSPTGSKLDVYLFTGTGNDQNIYGGFTGQVTAIFQQPTITTTWQRFTYTATLNATATQIAPYFLMNPTGTAGANDWVEITGVQIDLGSVALPYRRAGGTLAGELAACQRYYWRFNGSNYNYFATGANRSTTLNDSCVRFPVTMRSVPSFNNSTANTFMVYQPNTGTIVTCTALFTDGASNDSFGLTATVASGLTAGNAANLRANNATAWLEFSSEL